MDLMALIKEIASFTPGYSHTYRIKHFLISCALMKFTIPGRIVLKLSANLTTLYIEGVFVMRH